MNEFQAIFPITPLRAPSGAYQLAIAAPLGGLCGFLCDASNRWNDVQVARINRGPHFNGRKTLFGYAASAAKNTRKGFRSSE